MKRYLTSLALVLTLIPSSSYAILPADQEAVNNQTTYYIANDQDCPSTSAATPTVGGTIELSYTNGSRPIAVTVYMPSDNLPHPLLVFAPGRGQTAKTDGMYARYQAAIAAKGFVVAGVSFSDNSQANNGAAIGPDAIDINSVIPKLLDEAKIRDNIAPGTGVGLFGHSDGGDVVLRVNSNSVKAILSASPDPGGTSNVPLMVMVGTADFTKQTAEGVYRDLNPSFGALAEFVGSVHTGYLSAGNYSAAADNLTGAFFQRFLEGDSSASSDLKQVASKYGTQVQYQDKGSNIPAGNAPSTSSASTPAANTCCPSAGSVGSTVLSGADNAAKIYNYLVNTAQLQPFQAAGIMGNIQGESGFGPETLQNLPGVLTPAESLTPGQLSDTNLGWGIVQWTPPGKYINTIMPTTKANDLATQLDFLWGQLQGKPPLAEKGAGDAVKASTDVVSATQAFESLYERHYGPPDPGRVSNAVAILAKFGSGAPSGSAAASPDSSSSACSAPTSTDGCINPITPAGSWIAARTDQGVDWQPTVPLPILAMCDGVVTQASTSGTGWPGDVFLSYKLTSGPYSGKEVYVAEHLIDVTIKVGDTIKAGQKIATALPGYPWTEWGWALAGTPDTPLQRPPAGGTSTDAGRAFTRWMKALGAHPLEDPGPGPLYP